MPDYHTADIRPGLNGKLNVCKHTMSNKALPNKSGLYGESIYPPMFDTEPPPLCDEDGDPYDDDFADFTSFQKTGTDDSSWSSWSDWSKGAGDPGKIQESGTVGNLFEQKPSKDVLQSGKGPDSSDIKGASMTSTNNEDAPNFGAFSKIANDETVFNGELSGSFSKSDSAAHGKNKTINQSCDMIEDLGKEMSSSNKGDHLENSSVMGFVKVTSSPTEADSKSTSNVLKVDFENENSVRNVVENDLYKGYIDQDKIVNTEVILDKEHEFDDFADFQSNENKNDSCPHSFDKQSLFADETAQGKFAQGSDEKLQNGFLKGESRFQFPKGSAVFDLSDMENKSGSFATDFGAMNKNTEVDFSFEGKLSGLRETEKSKDRELNSSKESNSIEDKELEIQEGIQKIDIGSDVNNKNHNKDLFNPLKEDIIASTDNQDQHIFDNNLDKFKAFSASKNEAIESSLFHKNEGNTSGDDMGIGSVSVGQGSSSKVSDFASRDVLANIGNDNVDVFEEVQNGTMNWNSLKNVSNSANDSSVENEGLSSKINLQHKETFSGVAVMPETCDFSDEDDFDDFKGITRSGNFPGNKEKDSIFISEDVASKGNDTCVNSNGEFFHQPEVLQKPSERHVESPTLDLFANMKSSNQLNLKHRDSEDDTSHSFPGSDVLVAKGDSSVVTPGMMETKFPSYDSDNEKLQSVSNSEEEFSDFKNFDEAILAKDRAQERTDIQQSIKHIDASTDYSSISVNIPSTDNDDFEDFQEFSASVDDSVAKKPEVSYQGDLVIGRDNSSASLEQKDTDDQWADFNSAEQGEPSENSVGNNFGEFAAFPVDDKQNNDDNNWASFGTLQSEGSSQSSHFENETGLTAGNEHRGLSAAKTTGVFPSNTPYASHEQIHRNSTIPVLLAPCFPRKHSSMQPVGSYIFSKIEQFLQDNRDQELHGIWGKISGKEGAEDTWKLSYSSSTSFNWLLQSINVTFENITKKYAHSSRDTLSSLSPASSVASFDMEMSGDQILVPEPATRLSSLLKPTLLAQSQQKELDLQSVQSVSSLKKGEGGSDSTSETSSLDLEFFSGASTAIPASSNLTGSSSSLNNIELRDIAVTADSSTGKAESQGMKQPNLPPRGGKGSTSLPFNLGSISNFAVKEEISKEAKQYLEDIENLRFMSSTVLLFPSQFSSSE